MTDETWYVAMGLHRWADCELNGCPTGFFGGLNDGSVGFMPVFDDVAKLKELPDGTEITKIMKAGE